jgi:hypothetical protein
VARLRGAAAGVTGAWNHDPIRSYGLRDVLELPLARIHERKRQLAGDVIVDCTRHEHATGLGERFQPSRDVDAVTVDSGVVVDHIAQIDAHAKPHASMLGDAFVALGHHGLNLDRTLRRGDHAGKFSQNAVAGGVDDPSTVPADERQDGALMRLEVAHGGGLVLVHESAVAGDIGGENGGKPTVHRGLSAHGPS